MLFSIPGCPFLHDLVDRLAGRFDYVSILGTDDSGLSFRASPGETGSSEPMWVQRGFVLRAQSKGRVVESAFNELGDEGVATLAASLGDRLETLIQAASSANAYPPLPDAPARQGFLGELEIDPFSADPDFCLKRLAAIRDSLLASPGVISAFTRADFVHVSRCFISPRRELVQSFDWAQAYAFGVARKGEVAKSSYRAASGPPRPRDLRPPRAPRSQNSPPSSSASWTRRG